MSRALSKRPDSKDDDAGSRSGGGVFSTLAATGAVVSSAGYVNTQVSSAGAYSREVLTALALGTRRLHAGTTGVGGDGSVRRVRGGGSGSGTITQVGNDERGSDGEGANPPSRDQLVQPVRAAQHAESRTAIGSTNGGADSCVSIGTPEPLIFCPPDESDESDGEGRWAAAALAGSSRTGRRRGDVGMAGAGEK